MLLINQQKRAYMDNPRCIEQERVEEDSIVEITDLDQIDGTKSRLPPWLSRKALALQRPENRWHWRWATLVGIIFLTFLVIVLILGDDLSVWLTTYLHIGFSPQPSINSIAVSPFQVGSNSSQISRQDGLACLVDATWSPDGTLAAILGYTQGCPHNDFVPAQVNVYDTHTGKLVAHWTPDYPVTRTLYGTAYYPASLRAVTDRKPLPGTNGGFVSVTPIYYTRILWSPDGRYLALTFTASTRLHNYGGVMLIGSDGNAAQVFLQQQSNTNPLYSEWNLSLGAPVNTSPAPTALGYSWGSSGSLLPRSVLNDQTLVPPPPVGPVGNPDGGYSFTIWQPGVAIIVSQAHSPSVYIWKTNVAAWSADGNYLVEGINLRAIIEPTGSPFPDPMVLTALNLNHTPLLPVHDTALLRATSGSLAIAWRPDGRVLATTNFTGSVDLYDCTTGQMLESLKVLANRPPIAGSSAMLRWSPDGTHLLLSSAQWGILNIWGPGQLPQMQA
jgi:WD40 repeat protein